MVHEKKYYYIVQEKLDKSLYDLQKQKHEFDIPLICSIGS